MKGKFEKILFIAALIMPFFQSCIHEYPVATGVDPDLMNAKIEITFDLYWERMLHNLDISTRDRSETEHRFLIEVSKKGEIYNRDIVYLSKEEFSLGSLKHSLSLPISSDDYDIAVWYEKIEEGKVSNFDTEDFSRVKMLSNIPTHETPSQCGYARDRINLTQYKGRTDSEIIRQLELQHAGARFEIVATDVQQFITDQKAALNQGETFFLNLNLHSNSSYTFNLYDNSTAYQSENFKFTGDLFFPFAEYDELKIAEGFLFCEEEDNITMNLNVFNSSLMLVTQTEDFTFPVRRGTITTVRGNFLTSYLDGLFSINNIWDGEIVIEI